MPGRKIGGRIGVWEAVGAAAVIAVAVILVVVLVPSGKVPVRGTAGISQASPQLQLSGACQGYNAEIVQAIDPARHAIYEEWIGCGGIGFARSTDDGRSFEAAIQLPHSAHTAGTSSWDPAVVLGPRGAVYAAFMFTNGRQTYPVVDISADGGRTFTVRKVATPAGNNFGDRDYIAVNSRGDIYLTWDYGPRNDIVPICYKVGSCSFSAGDVNEVLQTSADGGRTWSKIIPISPGYPGSGADIGPVLVEPDGRLDVLFQAFPVLNRTTFRLGRPGHDYFTTSVDGGHAWSAPVRLGPAANYMTSREWWIDGSLGIDAAGNLYATWDTQSGRADVGWLSYSTDHGRTWTTPARVTAGRGQATNIVQVIGGAAGQAYVAWLTDGPAAGYAQFLRPYSIAKGWLSPVVQVSDQYGASTVWPGDTIGLSLLAGGGPGARRVAVSWGSANSVTAQRSDLWFSIANGLP